MNYSIHDQLQQLVEDSLLIDFQFSFNRDLYETKREMEIIKEYSVIMKDQEYLDHLYLKNSKKTEEGINRDAGNGERVKTLIDEVSNM